MSRWFVITRKERRDVMESSFTSMGDPIIYRTQQKAEIMMKSMFAGKEQEQFEVVAIDVQESK